MIEAAGYLVRVKVYNTYLYLLGYPHGHNKWTIFKGCLKRGETHQHTAQRELFEESNIDLDDPNIKILNKDYKSNIINVYNLKKKRITVFLVDINLESYKKLNLCCNSLIDGTYNPEIVEYDLFTADELEMVLLNSQKHLAKVVKELESNK